jgi:hypothetical protein
VSHGKRVYSCGCLAYQCRCIEGHRNVTTLPYPCPKHVKTTAELPLDEVRASDWLHELGLLDNSVGILRDRERLIDEARD